MKFQYETLCKYKLRMQYILFIIIVTIGLVARLYEVQYNFDGDEIFSLKLASNSFLEVIQGSLQDRPHPPLHNVLLHLWIKAFGTSEVSVRTLSVLFSGIFLVVSYVLLRRLVTPWLALGILSILALSPLFVYYGQQARPYALIACLSSVNLLSFIRVLDVPQNRKRLAIWAASCTLLVYTQYLGTLLIAFQIILAFLYLHSERLAILAYGIAGSVLILPWLIAAMGNSLLRGADPLLQISWMRPPSFTNLAGFYVSIFGKGFGLQVLWLLFMLAFLVVAYIKHLVVSKNLPANHALLFLIAAGLPTVVYLLSAWGPKAVFAGRQLLGGAIAFVAAIGLCIATLPRSLAAGLLLSLLAWTAMGLPQAFPHNKKPPWKDIAAQIDERYGMMVVVTQEDWVRRPLDYYRKSGTVRLWSDVSELEENDVLFVCRTLGSRCSNVEIEALKSRCSLIKRWDSVISENSELRLYKIRGISNQSRPKWGFLKK